MAAVTAASPEILLAYQGLDSFVLCHLGCSAKNTQQSTMTYTA